nr:unnamed protein product [Spirometra erinaceieuropaei]
MPLIRTTDGVEIADSRDKAAYFSQFFQSVYTNEARFLPPSTEELPTPSLSDILFSEDIVRKESEALDKSKSPGPDEIPPKLLKELASELSVPLSMLFQTSFDTGTLPTDWKLAHITPLHQGTPKYGLAKWLFRRLKFLTAESDTTVSSSAEFLEKLKGDLAIETVELLLQSKYDETENRLGRAQVLQLLQLCLRTHFTFDGTINEQVKGTLMGSPISGFIAEAVLQRLESLVFQHNKPKFWVLYV